MCRTIHSLLLLILVVGVVASVGAQSEVTSDVTRVSGTIQEVDVAAGHFTLESTAGRLMELHAPPALLRALQTGDVVEVMMAGPNAMILRRQVSGPPLEADETLPPSEEVMSPPLPPSDERREGS